LLGTGAIIGIIVGVLLLLVIIVVVWYVKTLNSMIRLENRAEEAFSTIDVYLKKRYDLIPNLVETVKGYAKHEESTLEKVISARNASGIASTPEEKMAAAKQLNSSLKVLLNAVSENYPDLKANANFIDLQNQLKNMESEIEGARRYYNAIIKKFNTKIQIFPSSIVAKGRYEKKNYFELDSEEERKNVKVQF
jgi:LemA protein